MEKINSKFITFYKTFGGLGLLISKARLGAYVAIANEGSSSISKPDLKFPSSKSNCTGLNKWHIISVTWSNKGENLSNCWLQLLLCRKSWYDVWMEQNTLNRLHW